MKRRWLIIALLMLPIVTSFTPSNDFLGKGEADSLYVSKGSSSDDQVMRWDCTYCDGGFTFNYSQVPDNNGVSFIGRDNIFYLTGSELP